MCGIAGFCNLHRSREAREQTIRRMADRMRERGPDAEGYGFYAFAGGGGPLDVTFGHRRLSIIDLSEAGAQPMDSHSGRLSIAYNGEIYNHREIARALEEGGFVRPGDWRGSSDTEILLEAIEAWGMDAALERCRGMFAIAVYDRRTGAVSLARDRIGEKPLYYGFVGGSFAFASDIGCFRELPGFAGEIRRDVLPLYLVHGYIRAPYTIYRDLWKLEPGTILTVEPPYAYFDPERELHRGRLQQEDSGGDGHRYRRWWSLARVMRRGWERPFAGSFEEASRELERLLTESIRGQMVADVPLGAFLSAGIDSSTIVSLMQRIAGEAGGPPVRTFTIGMREEGFNEAEVAAQIAAHLGTDHTERYISKQDALAVIPRLARMFGEPFADSSQIPTYLVSAMTREHVTVSLSGDAGDELFCGYTSYFSIHRIWNKLRRLPYPARRAAGALLGHLPGVARRETLRLKARLLGARDAVHLHWLESDCDPIIGRLSGGGEVPYEMTRVPVLDLEGPDQTGWKAVRGTRFADLVTYHPDDILVKVDRCAMANSLETRVPLLDPGVVEFAAALPAEYLVEHRDGGFLGKRILRDVLYRHVPRALMDRPKKGFSIPIERWLLEEPLRHWAEELLEPGRIRSQGLLDPDVVRQLWTDYTERGSWRVQIWYVLMLGQWLQEQE